MILFLANYDTEILTLRTVLEGLPPGFPSVRAVNPNLGEGTSLLDDFLSVRDDDGLGDGTGREAGDETGGETGGETGIGTGQPDRVDIVIVRLLGGRLAWEKEFDELRAACLAGGVALLAMGGEVVPDAELIRLSTVPSATVVRAFAYAVRGGLENMENMLRFVADTVLFTGFGFDPPVEVPACGIWGDRPVDPARPTVAVVFYRAHLQAGNTSFVTSLADALEDAACNVRLVYCYSLRSAPGEENPVLDFLRDADLIVTTVLAAGSAATPLAGAPVAAGSTDGSLAGTRRTPTTDGAWTSPLDALGVPVLQAIASLRSFREWEEDPAGLSPLDVAMSVAIPEFDGRVVTVPFSFKEVVDDGDELGLPVTAYRALPERVARVAGLAARISRLGRTLPAEKKVAVVLSAYPTKRSRIGNAVGLDTPASAVGLLSALQEAGYRVDRVPESGDALMHELADGLHYDRTSFTPAQLHMAPGRLNGDAYCAWFESLPESLRARVEASWGPPPGEIGLDQGDLVFAGVDLGNVAVFVQPPRGHGEDPIAVYHSSELPPAHHYLGFYHWLDKIWGADACVHLGKHGTLEWLPGKSVGLSAACAPDAALADLPFFYPFVVNDPGEGTQAKRRAHAVVVDHLIPPMTRAEVYDDLARLETLLDEHARIESLDPAKLPAVQGRVWDLIVSSDLHRDLGRGAAMPSPDEFGALIESVDGYLCELKDAQIRGGLHLLGVPPAGEAELDFVLGVTRLPQAGAPSLRAAVATELGVDLADASTAALDAVEAECRTRLAALQQAGWPKGGVPAGGVADTVAGKSVSHAGDNTPVNMTGTRGKRARESSDTALEAVADPMPSVAARALGWVCDRLIPNLGCTGDEITNLLCGLDGKHVPAGPSGAPTRGMAHVLPTGRNFYSIDPRSVPSPLAWEVGVKLADALLERHLEETGTYPETVGLVVWGTAAMRTHGDDLAQAFALLGVRPVWAEESGRVMGLEVIPSVELGRPRIDVTLRISGFFRDAFPELVALFDDAVTLAAACEVPSGEGLEGDGLGGDPPTNPSEGESLGGALEGRLADSDDGPVQAVARAAPEQFPNFVRAHGVEDPRVFGPKPGAYGSGVLPLIETRNWRSDEDLAEVYMAWSGWSYRRGEFGAPARAAMIRRFAAIDVAVKNQDNREHDIFDSDDYLQDHGGMIATVRVLRGEAPLAWFGDSADPSAPRVRSLAEEAARVVRTRVVNPKWIEAMCRHGYKGAFELSATVDYLFGYDATAGIVEDWMYEKVTAAYVADPAMRDFFAASNPWALTAIAERLLEADERGMWKATAASRDILRSALLEAEGWEEERAETRETEPGPRGRFAQADPQGKAPAIGQDSAVARLDAQSPPEQEAREEVGNQSATSRVQGGEM